MEKQNVTLSIPKEVLLQAKIIAVKRGTSLSGVLTDALMRMVEGESAYEQAMQRSFEIMERGIDFELPPLSRDEAHER